MDTPTIPAIRQAIWKASHENIYTIEVAKRHINFTNDWEALLKEIQRMGSTRITPVIEDLQDQRVPEPEYIPRDHDYKARYREAHLLNFKETYPAAWRDGHYAAPTIPKVVTSNGLTTYIINFILWNGYRATRINVSGRLIDAPVKQASGVILTTKKYMHSQTRKGSADISSTVKGKSVMWEIKIGRDRPSPNQLKEQLRERKAGGEYFFIHTVDEFLSRWDDMVYG